MKKDIHPTYVPCEVTCACGNTFTIMSTTDKLRIEICNKCHPFFTGNERVVDTSGKIDKFKQRYGLK